MDNKIKNFLYREYVSYAEEIERKESFILSFFENGQELLKEANELSNTLKKDYSQCLDLVTKRELKGFVNILSKEDKKWNTIFITIIMSW